MIAQDYNQEVPFNEYPELKQLCWSEHLDKISREAAFHKYLDDWGFINKHELTPKEIKLIKILDNQFGQLINVHEIPSSKNIQPNQQA